MRFAIIGFIVLSVLILAAPAMAATLHGSIYDIELNELTDVIVEVDSEPMQRQVAKDGQYSFELNPGSYTLTANYTDGLSVYSTEESISITDDGVYIYDLFMFPEFKVDDEELFGTDDGTDVLSEISSDVFDERRINWNLVFVLSVVVVLVALIVAYFALGHVRKRNQIEELEEIQKLEDTIKGHQSGDVPTKKLKVEPDQFVEDVLEVIRSEGGRTTQKEIRKYIPLSEAKISLIISELEHKKIVQKVKKGRGNIIILNKN